MLYDSKGKASGTLLQAREHKLGLTSPPASGKVVNNIAGGGRSRRSKRFPAWQVVIN
jgi:hypothetical protein